MKRYLQCGESICLDFYGRVGPSGTIVDVHADAAEMIEACRNNPDVVGEGVGTILRGGVTFDVFIETATGRFWYDEESGY